MTSTTKDGDPFSFGSPSFITVQPILTSVRYKLVQIANLSFRWSVATKAAGLDNAGSKWSREAQTKFVPRGLRQGSIINKSQTIRDNRDVSHTLPLAPLGGELRFEMTNTIQTHQFIAKILYRTQVNIFIRQK